MSHSILIVDDDPTQRRLLQGVLEKSGYATCQAQGGREAIDMLGKDPGIQLMLLDLVMPEMDGMEVLADVRPMLPDLPVIILTSKGGVDTVVGAMREGANDFVVKPASPERLLVSIQNALERRQLSGEVSRLKRKQGGTLGFSDLIASSTPMQQVVRLGERAAQSNIPILVEGESGVGKEIIARAIQGSSDRSGKPFVTVNCGAIPEHLIESILFGHEKGAFTGANEKHAGKFQEAHTGTLFLDEIGELRLDMQVKLLRALQEGEIDPIGSKKPTKIDIRLISATNRDLMEMAQAGEFREDLYYRLNVFPVWIPPLRDRMEDIADMTSHFIQRFASEENKRVIGIDSRAVEMLMKYQWPGNVRQLENSIFRAVVLCDADHLRIQDFPQIAAFTGVEIPSTVVPLSVASSNDTFSRDPIDHLETGSTIIPTGDPQAASSPTTIGDMGAFGAQLADGLGIHPMDDEGHLRALDDVEGEMIRLAIDKYSGQMSEIARRLGIGRSTLYRKVRELGLDVRGTGTDD